MIAQHTANVRGSYSAVTNKTFQIRVDVGYNAMVSFLRNYHSDSSWWIEQRTESVGVYVTCSKQLRDIVFGFGQGYKACNSAVVNLGKENKNAS